MKSTGGQVTVISVIVRYYADDVDKQNEALRNYQNPDGPWSPDLYRLWRGVTLVFGNRRIANYLGYPFSGIAEN